MTKQIVDNEFGIAVFELKPSQDINNLKEVVKFVNEYASVLNFKNRTTVGADVLSQDQFKEIEITLFATNVCRKKNIFATMYLQG